MILRLGWRATALGSCIRLGIYTLTRIGAGEGNRTLASGMGGPRSTIELHPLSARGEVLSRPGKGWQGEFGGKGGRRRDEG